MVATMNDGIATTQQNIIHRNNARLELVGTNVEDCMTAAQAIEKAHLDWEVKLEPVYRMDRLGDVPRAVEIPNRQAIVRADTNEVFTIQSKGWKPVQNSKSFSLLDDVVGSGEAKYKLAASFDGGRRVVLVAELPETMALTQEDTLSRNIVLVNGHDGHTGFAMKRMAVRLYCTNVIPSIFNRMRSTGGDGRFWAPHTSGIDGRMGQAREMLGTSELYFANMLEGIKRMADSPFDDSEIEPFLFKVFQIGDDKKRAELRGTMKAAVERATELFYTGTGNHLDVARGTKWGMFNALTEYLTWEKGVGGRVDTVGSIDSTVVNKRLDSILFGTAGNVVQKGWDILSRPDFSQAVN